MRIHMDDIVRAHEILESLAVGGARLDCLWDELDASTLTPSFSDRADLSVNICIGQTGTTNGTPMRR